MKNAIIIFLGVIVLSASDALSDFSYPNFSDTTGLTLNRDAQVITVDFSQRVRLVPSGAIYGGGSMYYNEAQDMSSFHTSFCFRIGELGGITNDLNPDSGADGIAFVIQPYGPDFIAHTGGGQGYEGADNTLAIEFDCWDNGPSYNEPSRSHVGVMVDGIIDHNWALATADVGDMVPGGLNEIDSGIFWWATIDYEGGILTVKMGQPPFNWFEVLSVPVDISAIVENDTAWVGFTGGTGLAHANHDICSWSYVPEPVTMALLGVGGVVVMLKRKRKF